MQFAELPPEIRNLIYQKLLAQPCAVVEYVPDRFKSGFKARSQTNLPISLAPQVLRVSRQVKSECLPILYGSHRFNCGFSILGVEKLKAQIGARNFSHIRHLILDWFDVTRISCALRSYSNAKLYRSLETVTIYRFFRIDLDRDIRLLKMDLFELRKSCQSASTIVRQHPFLRIIGQVSTKHLQQPETAFRIKWRFLRSASSTRPNVSNL